MSSCIDRAVVLIAAAVLLAISGETAFAQADRTGPNLRTPQVPKGYRVERSGVVQVSVSALGMVTAAHMSTSTGKKSFDDAAVSAFLKARFKPGTAPAVRIPVAFSRDETGKAKGYRLDY